MVDLLPPFVVSTLANIVRNNKQQKFASVHEFFTKVYVDASNSCNQLAFQLASAAATTITRSWSIKVTQYSCDYPNLAPNGCDQVRIN